MHLCAKRCCRGDYDVPLSAATFFTHCSSTSAFCRRLRCKRGVQGERSGQAHILIFVPLLQSQYALSLLRRCPPLPLRAANISMGKPARAARTAPRACATQRRSCAHTARGRRERGADAILTAERTPERGISMASVQRSRLPQRCVKRRHACARYLLITDAMSESVRHQATSAWSRFANSALMMPLLLKPSE